jgi:hypothetical protein
MKSRLTVRMGYGMCRKAAFIFLSALLCICCRAQNTNVLGMASPKLKQFLTDHPVASTTLSSVVSEAFASRKIRLYYFYSEDESIPRAFHYYPDESSVGIAIRENQQPCDECISLIFEVLNSEGEKVFQQLMEQAKAGNISKAEFVEGVMRQEFHAVMKTQEIIGSWKLTQKEIAASYDYNRFMQGPNKFEEYLSYQKTVSPKRDLPKEYGQQYDELRKEP